MSEKERVRQAIDQLKEDVRANDAMTLQQQLAEMREFSPTFVVEDEIYVQVLQTDFNKLLDTLQAILDIQKKEPLPMRSIAGDSFMEGYNSALSTVAEVAGEGMRG